MDPQSYLILLRKNWQILHERAAKYAGEASVALLNEIEDYEHALRLLEEIDTTIPEWPVE